MFNQSLARIMYGSSDEVRNAQSRPAAWALQATSEAVAAQRVNDESALEKLLHKAWNAISAK